MWDSLAAVEEAAELPEASEATVDEAPLTTELTAELAAEVAALATDDADATAPVVSWRRWRGEALTAPTAARAATARLESILMECGLGCFEDVVLRTLAVGDRLGKKEERLGKSSKP